MLLLLGGCSVWSVVQSGCLVLQGLENPTNHSCYVGKANTSTKWSSTHLGKSACAYLRHTSVAVVVVLMSEAGGRVT